MNVEISKTTEEAIAKALATGRFSTAEAFLEAAAKDFAAKQLTCAPEEGAQSAYDAFQALGVIGCMKDGPVDLSTNPKHMEGFGQ